MNLPATRDWFVKKLLSLQKRFHLRTGRQVQRLVQRRVATLSKDDCAAFLRGAGHFMGLGGHLRLLQPDCVASFQKIAPQEMAMRGFVFGGLSWGELMRLERLIQMASKSYRFSFHRAIWSVCAWPGEPFPEEAYQRWFFERLGVTEKELRRAWLSFHEN